MTYKVTVTSNTDSDIQPVVASLAHPSVAWVQGIDTDRVWLGLVDGAASAEFERAMDADPDVLRYVESES